MATTIRYIKTETAKVYQDSTTTNTLLELLWGDRVEILSDTPVNGRFLVKARWAKNVFIESGVFGETPLLELYFIDVGQGDGVLIVTPERKHILIDGGYTRERQPHGKSAADFVDWKFFEEYGLNTIKIDAMISSHCDADHYGGLWDLLNVSQKPELDTSDIQVEHFYHAGVSWWKTNTNPRFLGNTDQGMLTDLITDKASIVKALDPSSNLRLQGEWADFLECIITTNASVERLAHNPDSGFKYLPSFEEDKEMAIKVLGPIEKTINGNPALKDLIGDSQNTNGNSVLLRIDCGHSRILLTGDLNLKSQQFIMQSLAGNEQELAADVVKACHHGSDDCSFEFLKHVKAAATIISSGDDETHSHPRPNIVAASGLTGFKKMDGDRLVTPLVYSTEISRSIRIGTPYAVTCANYNSIGGIIPVNLSDGSTTKFSYKVRASGAMGSKNVIKQMDKTKIVDGMVYGLVNVRTDGTKILCAVLNEGKAKWEFKTFDARF